MKWQCALLQRWLPEYPDGDLPGFWKARLKSHLEHCPACAREAAALGEVVKAIKAVPVADPGPEFWTEFSRELHLKLAQAAHAPQAEPPALRPWFSRIPYFVGASALAGVLLWVGVQYLNPDRPVLAPQPQMAQEAAPAQDVAPVKLEESRAKMARGHLEMPVGAVPVDQFTAASLAACEPAREADLDVSSWDLDDEFACMSDQEKEAFLKRLHQQQKDGSWAPRFSAVSLA